MPGTSPIPLIERERKRLLDYRRRLLFHRARAKPWGRGRGAVAEMERFIACCEARIAKLEESR